MLFLLDFSFDQCLSTSTTVLPPIFLNNPSIHLFIYHSIYLSLYLSITLSIYHSVYLSLYLSISLSIYHSIYLSLYLSITLSIHHSIYLSLYLSITPSIYLSVYLSIYHYFYLSIDTLSPQTREPVLVLLLLIFV